MGLLGEDGEADGESIFDNVGQPGLLESFIPIWGSGRAAIADYQAGNYGWAAFNGLLTLADLTGAGLVVRLGKYGVKRAAPFVWDLKPWEKGESARAWLGRIGYLKPGQHGHHWGIPRNGWGRYFPDWLKNQPWNILPMKDEVVHGRLHGPYTPPGSGEQLKEFNSLQKFYYGTPGWAKSVGASIVGHGVEGWHDPSKPDGNN